MASLYAADVIADYVVLNTRQIVWCVIHKNFSALHLVTLFLLYSCISFEDTRSISQGLHLSTNKSHGALFIHSLFFIEICI